MVREMVMARPVRRRRGESTPSSSPFAFPASPATCSPKARFVGLRAGLHTLFGHDGKRAAAELSNLVATAVFLIVGPLCVLGMLFSPQLVRLLAPGFEQVPGKFALTVQLTRIMFPFLLLVALAAQAMGALNASGRFGVPALASSLFNIGSVACGLALGYTVGRWDRVTE